MSETGKFALIHYTGKLENGDVFDSSIERTPFEFQLGAGNVIPGFDKAVSEMTVGDKKEVTIQPEDAYGEYREDLIQEIPRADFPAEMEPEKDKMINVQLTDGQHIPAKIVNVTEEQVSIDMNMPLAGKTLIFELELLELNDEAKMASGCAPSDCGSCSSSCE